MNSEGNMLRNGSCYDTNIEEINALSLFKYYLVW